MGGRRVRMLAGLGCVGFLALGACRLLLPDHLAVNAPLANLIFGAGREPPGDSVFGERIQAAPGFGAGLYASVPKARLLRFTSTGDLLVSVPREGRIVYVERDADGDGRADAQRTLLEGLNRPHGIDLRAGWLYVAETDAVGRVRFDALRGTTEGPFERVVTGLPAGGNHGTRTLRFGPDGWMYVSVGSSCNVCEEKDPRRAALLRFRPDGSKPEVFATGLRNAVGFDWHPDSLELYATDNGRDLLGDDFPPCELNRIVRGGFYGWPYANGNRRPDPDLGAGHAAEVARSLPPAHGFRAHNAPLGMTFVRGAGLPAAYRGSALVALHGSWNRTRKDGYKVVSLHWRGDGTVEERDFLWGFLRDENVVGRPVDVAEGPDGALYVSDDYAGAIYRVAFGEAPVRGRAERPGPARGEAPDALSTAEREASVRRGRGLYERHACADCHAADRAAPGVTPVLLEDLRSRYDVEALAGFLRAPAPPMPTFPLSEQESRDLARALFAEP